MDIPAKYRLITRTSRWMPEHMVDGDITRYTLDRYETDEVPSLAELALLIAQSFTTEDQGRWFASPDGASDYDYGTGEVEAVTCHPELLDGTSLPADDYAMLVRLVTLSGDSVLDDDELRAFDAFARHHLGLGYVADQSNEDLVSEFREHYRGEHASLTEWAEDFISDVYAEELSNLSVLRSYIDVEAYARDAELGGQVWTAPQTDGSHYVFVFSS